MSRHRPRASGGRTLPLNTPLKEPTLALPMFEPSPWLAAVHSTSCAPGVPATPATLPAGHSIKLLACKPPSSEAMSHAFQLHSPHSWGAAQARQLPGLLHTCTPGVHSRAAGRHLEPPLDRWNCPRYSRFLRWCCCCLPVPRAGVSARSKEAH